jgi:hypothetical protein
MTDHASKQLETSDGSVAGAGVSRPAPPRRIPGEQETRWLHAVTASSRSMLPTAADPIWYSPLTEELAERIIAGLRAL